MLLLDICFPNDFHGKNCPCRYVYFYTVLSKINSASVFLCARAIILGFQYQCFASGYKLRSLEKELPVKKKKKKIKIDQSQRLF